MPSGRNVNRAANAKTTISTRFTAGPARPTRSMSRRRFRRRLGFTGTGLAQPNAGSPPRTAIAGRMIDPSGSMWGTGLSVSRPARLAVSSPCQSATTPWAISWTMIDATSATKYMIS
jgi:hypothetical protein